MSMVTGDEARGPIYRDKQHLMVYLDEAGQLQPVKSLADWQVRRQHIIEQMRRVMGEMPDASRRSPLAVEILATVEAPLWVRYQLTYQAEPGDRVPAYLFVPHHQASQAGALPGGLCLHQTTTIGKGEPAGLGGLANLHYARELAEQGMVTLAPDYPNFGDYVCDPYEMGYVSATMKGIWNHRRALDLLQERPEVDACCLGCIGHSLGGHNSLYLAAWDERVKVVVTSCGFNSFYKYMQGNLQGWSHRGYMPRIADWYHCRPDEMPFDFTEVLAAIAPRAVFVNAPMGDSNFEVSGVIDCLQAAQPVYELHGAIARLVGEHPEAGHDFPPDTRQRAYEFMAQQLAAW